MEDTLTRVNIIEESESGLITIAGGKWTTYRSMAEETVDYAVKHNDRLIVNSGCQTRGLLLEGAHEYVLLSDY